MTINAERIKLQTTRSPIWTRPIWRLGRNRLLVRTFEWLTLCPYCGALPQMLHLCAMVGRSAGRNERGLYHRALK